MLTYMKILIVELKAINNDNNIYIYMYMLPNFNQSETILMIYKVKPTSFVSVSPAGNLKTPLRRRRRTSGGGGGG